MQVRILFIISFLCLSLVGRAQEIRVFSASDKFPIEQVAVFNSTRHVSAITDSLGSINLHIFRNSDTLIFQHPSYHTATYSMEELASISRISLKRKNILIDEYVISASRSRESKLVIPHMIDVLDEPFLRESTGLTSADILEGTGNILVQRTQGGGGSPILRGYEANKILLVVDGVRLNNAIYRNGHLQNAITIDHAILDRTEVIFGPSSIIYGSDALGGVIHYYTKDPELAGEKSTRFRGTAYTTYSSANNGLTAHLDLGFGKKRWAFLSSVTYKNLGDLKMGSWRNPTLGDWGKIMHYVDQVNGSDSTMVNQDPEVQLNTAYSQVDLLQKIRYAPSKYVDWILNLQYSTSSDIDRLDKLNDYAGDDLKYAAYYYGPQNRTLISLKNVLKKDKRLYTNMTNTMAFQRIDEDRYSRKFGAGELLTQQEDVYVFSLNTDLLKMWGAKHRLNYGLELNHNRVDSDAWYEDVASGSRDEAQTRYPEGGSLTYSASAYASYKWIMNKLFVLNGGMRYSYSELDSKFTAGILPYESISLQNGALTGSLGLVFTPNEKWQINSVLSTGFRNPNVDDYGKVRAKDEIISVPNDALSPEYTYNAELGLTRIVEGYIKITLVGFYSYLKDAILRDWYQLNDMDSLEYDGDMYRIAANYNAGEASIYGLALRFTSNLNKNITLDGTLNYTHGQNLSEQVPLGHIPPIFGRTTLSYKRKSFFFHTYVVYNGWKRSEDFSPFGEDNDAEAMEYGFPSWWTLNLKTGYQIGSNVRLMLAVENLLDQFYKPYASGISAAGRNFLLTLRVDLD